MRPKIGTRQLICIGIVLIGILTGILVCVQKRDCSEYEKKINISIEQYLKELGIIHYQILNCDNYDAIPYDMTENEGDKSYWKKLMNESEIIIDKREVANYSLKIRDNYAYIAELYGLSLEDYFHNVLKEDEKIFYQNCYEEGRFDIEKILLVGYIANEIGVTFSRKEVKEFCEKNNINDKNEEENYVTYKMIEQKVIRKMKGE